MRVFITGGTGLVGSRLVRALRKRGDEVVVLSRRADAWEHVGPDCTIVHGDPTVPGPWQDRIAECNAVVNLAGAGIFDKRWTPEYKQLIRDSRVKSTANVVDALNKAGGPEKVLVNASAIGYYGPHGDEELDESSPPGRDFMARICVDWEAAAREAEAAGVRVAIIRIGIVHDARGGALKQLLLPFKLGLGGPVGMALRPKDWGRQYWSWTHYADLTGILLLALDRREASGPINGTAPHPVTNKEFARAFGKVLRRPAFTPTPALALRLMLGEVAEVIAAGQRVLPRRALELGYRFQFPTIDSALTDFFDERPFAPHLNSRFVSFHFSFRFVSFRFVSSRQRPRYVP
jgi:uncharacterized protein (TIGR01777 family)